MGLFNKERAKSAAVEQKSVALTAQLSWCAHVWNATPEQAAKQIVSDLYQHLSRGGSVSVHVTEMGGEDHLLDVSAIGE